MKKTLIIILLLIAPLAFAASVGQNNPSFGDDAGAGSATTMILWHFNAETNDWSGNGVTLYGTNVLGTTTGFTCGPTNGAFGNCIAFQGTTNGLITTASTSLINVGVNSLTISFWLQTTNTGAMYPLFFQDVYSSHYCLIYIGVGTTTSGKIDFYVRGSGGSTGYSVTSTHTWNDGKWHNIVCVMDRTNLKVLLYADGYLDCTPATLVAQSMTMQNASCLAIGGIFQGWLNPAWATTGRYQGMLMEMQWQKTAWSPDFIRRFYTQKKLGWQ